MFCAVFNALVAKVICFFANKSRKFSPRWRRHAVAVKRTFVKSKARGPEPTGKFFKQRGECYQHEAPHKSSVVMCKDTHNGPTVPQNTVKNNVIPGQMDGHKGEPKRATVADMFDDADDRATVDDAPDSPQKTVADMFDDADATASETPDVVPEWLPNDLELFPFVQEMERETGKIWALSDSPVIYPPAIIAHLCGSPLMEQRRFGLIKGKTGAFKSSVAEMLLQLLLSAGGPEVVQGDYLGFCVPTDAPPVYVGLVDTEHDTETDIPALLRRLRYRIGDRIKQSFFVRSLKGRKRNAGEILRLLHFMRQCADANGDTNARLLLIIDVLSDFADGGNINDQEAARAFVEDCEAMANYYDAALIAILHENHANDKAAGWLGTIWTQKASWICTSGVIRNKDGHAVGGKLTHTKVRRGKEPAASYYDRDENGLFSVDAAEMKRRENSGTGNDGDEVSPLDALAAFVGDCFDRANEWSRKDLIALAKEQSPPISEYFFRDLDKKGPFATPDGLQFSLIKTPGKGTKSDTYKAAFGPQSPKT
jgi:hypothetical protein